MGFCVLQLQVVCIWVAGTIQNIIIQKGRFEVNRIILLWRLFLPLNYISCFLGLTNGWTRTSNKLLGLSNWCGNDPRKRIGSQQDSFLLFVLHQNTKLMSSGEPDSLDALEARLGCCNYPNFKALKNDQRDARFVILFCSKHGASPRLNYPVHWHIPCRGH